jgi:hypothetical protein
VVLAMLMAMNITPGPLPCPIDGRRRGHQVEPAGTRPARNEGMSDITLVRVRGFKQSGIGPEKGRQGMTVYMEPKGLYWRVG